MNKVLIFSIASGVVGLGAGAVGGYFLAEKKLVKQFDEILETQLANTKKFYERIYKTGDFETPEAAAEALGVPDGPVEEAADAIVNYGAKFVPGEAAVITPSGILVDEALSTPAEMMGGIGADRNHNVFGKEPGEPEEITFDEFAQIGDDYDSETVTYYMGDKVVADSSDRHLEDDHRCIGLDNLQKFHLDENLTELYVQNDRLKTVYEITRSTGKYSKEVLDVDDSLEHADNFAKMPRRRRLQDD